MTSAKCEHKKLIHIGSWDPDLLLICTREICSINWTKNCGPRVIISRADNMRALRTARAVYTISKNKYSHIATRFDLIDKQRIATHRAGWPWKWGEKPRKIRSSAAMSGFCTLGESAAWLRMDFSTTECWVIEGNYERQRSIRFDLLYFTFVKYQINIFEVFSWVSFSS